ncbi:hypothetical protein JOD29_001583 [Lysinibacillus composti]|nr:hypothetical protein [Lysinibacillus composti]
MEKGLHLGDEEKTRKRKVAMKKGLHIGDEDLNRKSN